MKDAHLTMIVIVLLTAILAMQVYRSFWGRPRCGCPACPLKERMNFSKARVLY